MNGWRKSDVHFVNRSLRGVSLAGQWKIFPGEHGEGRGKTTTNNVWEGSDQGRWEVATKDVGGHWKIFWANMVR